MSALRRLFAPIERFLAVEAASGIVLFAASAVSFMIAGSSAGPRFAGLLRAELGPSWFRHDVSFLVDDGLMTLFFLVVGLELRRELRAGSLADARRASLPLAAALGGMIAPACVYLALNRGLPSALGWGVPTATDIAFAVGVLALLGKRVPPALRVLLLALAVVDDVGAVLVIALFYAGKLNVAGFGGMALAVLAVLAMQRLRVRHPLAYVAPGVGLWVATHAAGVHATMAGVVLGLLCPVDGDDPPSERVTRALHGWVAYGVMPLFALVNAGVSVVGADLGPRGQPVFWGVAAGLVLGKPVGVVAASLLAVRLGVSRWPSGVGLRELLVLGVVAGVGFTMAVFVSGLAFQDPGLLATAKLAIVAGSVVAGLASYALGRALLPVRVSAGTEAEAERG